MIAFHSLNSLRQAVLYNAVGQKYIEGEPSAGEFAL